MLLQPGREVTTTPTCSHAGDCVAHHPAAVRGEEYAFRGWFLQNIGGLFANRIAAWVVPTVLSTGLFALLHGSLDPWILADLALFAIGVSVMTWRTGGLEAAVALHTCNNMLVLHFGLIIGGFEDSVIGPTPTGSPLGVASPCGPECSGWRSSGGGPSGAASSSTPTGPTRPRYRRRTAMSKISV